MWSAHRVRMIAACRAAGIDAIDGPFGEFKNDRAYMKQATYAATLGAVAQGDQAGAEDGRPVQRVGGEGGRGRRQGGQFVDAATLRIYEPVLERARATGRL